MDNCVSNFTDPSLSFDLLLFNNGDDCDFFLIWLILKHLVFVLSCLSGNDETHKLIFTVNDGI